MSKPHTILLDCDDTISTFMATCIERYNMVFNTNHTIDEITDWDISDIFNPPLWDIFEDHDVLQHMPIKEGAFETIKSWHEEGHKIVVVTGVDNVESYADKIKWLENMGLSEYIYEIIPTKHKELIKGDIFIDDNPAYLYDWKQNNPEGIPVLMTAQHNKYKEYDDLIRVDNWEDIDLLVTIKTEIF